MYTAVHFAARRLLATDASHFDAATARTKMATYQPAEGTVNKPRILATSVVLAVLVGCSNPQTQSSSPVQGPPPAATSATPSGTTSLSEVDAKKAQELATQVKGGVFP